MLSVSSEWRGSFSAIGFVLVTPAGKANHSLSGPRTQVKRMRSAEAACVPVSEEQAYHAWRSMEKH